MFSMQFKKYFIFIQFIILYDQYHFAMALVGPNVVRTGEHEFPAVVSVIDRINFNRSIIEKYHTCTGTLISSQDVLTAEHCLSDTYLGGFIVMYGSTDLHHAVEIFPLFIWTYEHWISFTERPVNLKDNDIVIIKLNANLPDSIQFAPNGNIDYRKLYGKNVVTVGWGRRDNNLKPRYLHKLELKVLKKDKCEQKYFNYTWKLIYVDHRFICSQSKPYGGLHKGDSGGPVFYLGALIAINNGAFPAHKDPPANQTVPRQHHVNIHFGIRFYREYIDEVTTTFRVNF